MNAKRWSTLFFLPLVVLSIACVCTSALPFGGTNDLQATIEAGIDAEGIQETVEAGIDAEGIEATIEAIGTVEGESGTEAEVVEEAAEEAAGVEIEIDPDAETEFDTVFPMPENVENFIGEGGEGMVNFQTDLTLEETIEFYRSEFEMMGLTERPLLTVINEDTFSMVFDGHENGQALVIQGVDLGFATNVNMRFEPV